MKTIQIILFVLSICSCNKPIEQTSSIVGTWKLLSVKTNQENQVSIKYYDKGIVGIKMLNGSHFSFFQHDLNKGQDSAAYFVAGGGSYSFDGKKYIENLEFCNYRVWEKNQFEFEITLKGDTLIQSGIEVDPNTKIKSKITETYLKIN